jgi:hypothetical protein
MSKPTLESHNRDRVLGHLDAQSARTTAVEWSTLDQIWEAARDRY